jgi:threonyl-tRNA synthetase
LGGADNWQIAETMLKDIIAEKKVDWMEGVGEAAFYGPKLDFMAKDAIGREWQVATIQLDMNMPERFDLFCINEQGDKERIVMIHAAIMGSIERFMAILIEHTAGAFPVWLCPIQVKLLSVGERHRDFCAELAGEFSNLGIRVEVDSSDETVGNKTRKAANEKIPYILVVGDKEMELPNLVVRDRGSRETREISKVDFIKELQDKINNRSL